MGGESSVEANYEYGENSGTDWNLSFQEALEREEGTWEQKVDKLQAILEITNRFHRTAERVGRTIIEELHLSESKKTIRPVEARLGLAGGAKYIVEGIFVKFMTDRHGLYGGTEFAMKAGSGELRMLRVLHERRLRDRLCGFSVPLSVSVEYRGYRLLCQSVLPLGRDTLKYGSCDQGVTVHVDDSPHIRSAMERLCTRLNLKEHRHENVTLFGPMDVEVHHGHDDRLYILDVARMMPPTVQGQGGWHGVLIPAQSRKTPEVVEVPVDRRAPGPVDFVAVVKDFLCAIGKRSHRDIDVGELVESASYIFWDASDSHVNQHASAFAGRQITGTALVIKGVRGQFLYRHLRPEFVQSYREPLNSDAFSPASVDEEDNAAVQRATLHLLETRIPKVAAKLDSRRLIFTSSRELVELLHANGINVRYLGLLHSHLRGRAIANFLMTEMVSRVVKTTLKAKMRSLLRKRASSLDLYASLLVDYLNLVFGYGERSNAYWYHVVPIHLLQKFSLPVQSIAGIRDFREHITSKFVLLQLLVSNSGIAVGRSVMAQLEEDPTIFEQPLPFAEGSVSMVPTLSTVVDVAVDADVWRSLDRLRLLRDASLGASIRDELESMRAAARRKRTNRRERLSWDAVGIGMDAGCMSGGYTSGESDAEDSPLVEEDEYGDPVVTRRRTRSQSIIAIDSSSGTSPVSPGGSFLALSSSQDPMPLGASSRDEQATRLRAVLKRQEDEYKLLVDIYGTWHLRPIVYLFRIADTLCLLGRIADALIQAAEGLYLLRASVSDVPAEVVVGYYYVMGSIYYRADRLSAARAFMERALEVLESVAGSGRYGLGHPFALVLTFRLVEICERLDLYAAAFRMCTKFEDTFRSFPFPLDDPKLRNVVFGEENLSQLMHDRLASVAADSKPSASFSSDAHASPWLLHLNIFDRAGDVQLDATLPYITTREIENEYLDEGDDDEDATDRLSVPGVLMVAPSPRRLNNTTGDAESLDLLEMGVSTSPVSPDSGRAGDSVHGGVSGDVWVWGSSESAALSETPRMVLLPRGQRVVDVTACDTHVAMATDRGRLAVLVLEASQQGVGGKSRDKARVDVLVPVLSEQLKLSRLRVVRVAVMRRSTYVLTATGRVLRTVDDELPDGVPVENFEALSFSDEGDEPFVVDVACGADHALFLTSSGQVFGLGAASEGQLGLGPHKMEAVKPVLLRTLEQHRVRALAAGGMFSVVMTDGGQLLSFGTGRGGQLGHPLTASREATLDSYAEIYPRRIMALSAMRMVRVACGAEHAMAMSDAGAVYVWGRNDAGQLGLPAAGPLVPVPQRLRLRGPAKSISCGARHSACVLASGVVYSWGAADGNRLGRAGASEQPGVVDAARHLRCISVAAASTITAALAASTSRRGMSPGGEARRRTAKSPANHQMVKSIVGPNIVKMHQQQEHAEPHATLSAPATASRPESPSQSPPGTDRPRRRSRKELRGKTASIGRRGIAVSSSASNEADEKDLSKRRNFRGKKTQTLKR